MVTIHLWTAYFYIPLIRTVFITTYCLMAKAAELVELKNSWQRYWSVTALLYSPTLKTGMTGCGTIYTLLGFPANAKNSKSWFPNQCIESVYMYTGWSSWLILWFKHRLQKNTCQLNDFIARYTSMHLIFNYLKRLLHVLQRTKDLSENYPW